MHRLFLKPGRESSLQRFHPWIFSGAVRELDGQPQEGDLIEVYANDGQYLATGHYQPGTITVRVISFAQTPADPAFWRQKLERALALRRQAGLLDAPDTTMLRLVHGEGDGCPGLIVDLYGGVAVIQCHSLGFYRIRHELAALLRELLGSRLEAVYDKSAAALPFKAPITPEDAYLLGSAQDWEGTECGARYRIDVEGGQKTGFFVDQRENRQLLRAYARGRSVLNLFCYTGGFSVAALQGGASRVHSVDSSKRAIGLTLENIALNFGPDAPHEAFAEEVFDFFQRTDERYDILVVDPPAFAKHQNVLSRALRGYRNLNQKAIARVAPGGLVFTFSCSQVVSREQFREAVFTAAAQTGRTVRILHQLSQPPDHPVNIYHPEGEYLKGLVLAVE
ncbi:MAG: class I SAM-dependent rRNA methyltransferase [Bacteroidia bacterium]|nr:class I SAM-dependent rRNA methyltransferase [Bacteroidia bacterium]